MRFRLFFILLLPALQSTAQSDTLLQPPVASHPFNGVVLLADNGAIWHQQAYGYRRFETAEPLQLTDIFELASVSKQFTAMIIMLLQQEGLLQYDDPIDRYLQVPYKGITIRHLLTHTSGLPDYQLLMEKHWDKRYVAGNDDILRYLNRYHPRMHFTPGQRYEYSNTGYVLLASIAEKVSSRDFIRLCREWIFKPLDMTDTDIRTPDEKRGLQRLAPGYQYVPAQQRHVAADSFPSSNYTLWLGNRKGPGRISSTVQDLLKWDQALYHHSLATATSLAEAFRPMRLTNGDSSYYGFGWDLEVHPVLGRVVKHNGDNPGYKTQIVRCIDARQTLIVLSNNAFAGFDAYVNRLLSALARRYQQQKAP